MNVITILCDTLRRDHCGPYHQGRPLNEVQSRQQPDWVVPTPNMDRLAERGTTFDNAWCGSTPCAPARRDIYTGRYEFLERGWGPLEDGDEDLPVQVSGPPNQSMLKLDAEGYRVSQLISDHVNLWRKGMGNYHMGYTGFEFIRGHLEDNWRTDPVAYYNPDDDFAKTERHFRNVEFLRENVLGDEENHFAARVFQTASEWLENNHEHDDFYLHIDCYDPHEPWDPPEELLKQFDERGYDVEEWESHPPYDKWEDHYTRDELRHMRARYAAMVVLVDRWLGHFLDTMDELGLWEDTLVVLTSDHGTWNGDHGRIGKRQTHEHDALGHIPFIAAHPEHGHGERRDHLVQLVDLYPTVLEAVDRPCPEDRHGRSIFPLLEDPDASHRDYAIAGRFGKSITITDGEWILHQNATADNKPLYWYGHHDAKFIPYELGPYEDGRREVDVESWETPTWLSDKRTDPNELENLAEECPEKLREMQRALRETLVELDAPDEQLDRLGIRDV